LKVQNINIKPLLKHLNIHNKPCFETAHLSENVAQNIIIYLGTSFFLSKKAILVCNNSPISKKITQFGHPAVSLFSPSKHCDKFQNYFDKLDQMKVLIGGITVSQNISNLVRCCKCLVSSYTLAPIFNQVIQSN
jgi:hypothetical protein